MRTAEEIERGLTEAQRTMLMQLPPDGAWALSSPIVRNVERRFGPNSLRGFGQSGLIEGYYLDPMKHRLTPFGVEVGEFLRTLTTGQHMEVRNEDG